MASTVMPSGAYVETDVHYAEPPISSHVSVDVATVTILKAHHDFLQRMANEYTALRNALLAGGITHEALEVLISGGEPDPVPASQYQDQSFKASGPTFHYQSQDDTHTTAGTSFGSSPSYATGHWRPKMTFGSGMAKSPWHSTDHDLSPLVDDESFFSEPAVPDVAAPDDSQLFYPNPTRSIYAKFEQRSIAIKNLSDRTTHSDLADIIRGGAVLEIFLRTRDKAASVSFLEGSAAAAFLQHAKRHDIYLHGKRLEFAWHDRQFILPSHVAGKIRNGATRNLVIRGAHPTITADRLREDLDHIHNLIIIEATFDQGDAFVSLNSIHNSLFARTCMMSRAAYKRMRIEWYPDECAQPLPKMPTYPTKATKAPEVKSAPTMLNRFQLLDMDGTNDDSNTDDDDDDDDDNISDYPSLPDQKSWINEGVTV